MAISAWSVFYPDVMLNVPGCATPIIDSYLRRAAIELCSKSRRLKLDMPAFNTAVGTPTYALAPGAGMETVSILNGSVAGKPIDPVRLDEVFMVENWRTALGTPIKYLMTGDDKTVRLWKTPDAIYAVALTLAIKPSQSATGIEAWFAYRYREAIISGALAGLFVLPKKPWTDGTLATFHENRFQSMLRTACADADKDGSRAPLRTVTYGA